MTELARCPCGEVPEEVEIINCDERWIGTWIQASGDCCLGWIVEGGTGRTSPEQMKAYAVLVWNRQHRDDRYNDAIHDALLEMGPENPAYSAVAKLLDSNGA